MPHDQKPFWLQGQAGTQRIGWIRFVPLVLLSALYGVIVRIRQRLYQYGILRTRRLPLQVVCVGNMTTGGTGKTPMVEYVARSLHDAGKRVAVLSRGYKGQNERSGGLVSDGHVLLMAPRESGDEPYMLAHRLQGIPVFVGRKRHLSGNKAYQRFDTEVAVLDDGYQHFQLARDLNIALVNGQGGFGNGHLLPWGPLREPLEGLTRADYFVITKTGEKAKTQAIEKTLRHWNGTAQIFHGRYMPEYVLDPTTGKRDHPDSLRGRKIVAFAGLASPHDFFELLRSLGAIVAKEQIFPDHHCYTQEDMRRIHEMAAETEWVVTTEKDMVRLRDVNTGDLPIRVLAIRMDIAEGEAFKRSLFTSLKIQNTAAPSRENA